MNFNKKISKIMTSSTKLFLTFILITFSNASSAQEQRILVDHFDKVIVSPHIEVNFVEHETEEVIIEDSKIALDKINVKVTGSTLRIYLDDAQIAAKTEKIKKENYKICKSIYNGKIATIKVHYKELKELSLRGEQRFVCESLIDQEKFMLKIYGEAEVVLHDVNLEILKTIIYGESSLDIQNGYINKQTYTNYGESEVDVSKITNDETKIISHGEGVYTVNAEEKLRVTAYGEANIEYTGNPHVQKGIIIGETRIKKI